MNPRKLISSLAVAVVCFTQPCSFTDDWPQWRGPARNGISQEKGLVSEFPDSGPAIVWKGNVGLGFSSIVVGQGKAFTAGHASEQDTVFCLDAATGKQLWKHSYPAELGDKYYEGGVTGTPTIDGQRVYWLSRWGDLFCFNAADGKVVWQRQLVKETGAQIPSWGFTGAPTIHGNHLILNVGGGGMAVDKQTGKEIWKSGAGEAGYTTPLPIKRGNAVEMWIANGEGYYAVQPESGKQLWSIKWLTQYGVNAADPIPHGDKVFISSGYGKGAALFPQPKAGGTEPEPIWKNRVLRTQLNPAVLVDKHVYGVDGDTSDKASLKCVEVETGKELWVERDFGSGGIIVADGKILALSAKGELMIAPVSPEAFKPSARAQVLGGKSWTAPVLANGLLYCRNSRGDIVAVDLRKK